ncbi:MAG: acetyl-CoA C-acyltransferase, partial [Acidobacteria bacterium]
GRFDAEIVPLRVPGKKGEDIVNRDEHPRPDTTAATLARLPPVFKPDGGTVTAGNSSGITDGAAAMVVLSAQRADELGVKPMARLLGLSSAGVDPCVMGIG